MNHAISINSDKTLVITLPEGTQVDRVMIRKMGTQESKLYWRDEVLDQYKWERDIAIQQLKELGYGFGQEPKTDGDTISRKAALSRISDLLILELKGERIPTWNEVYRALNELPSVQSELAKYSPKLDNENGELISRQEAIRIASGYCHPANIVKELRKLPFVQTTRKIWCEKCYWSDKKGCSIYCRAWNRYTTHSGFCHQYEDMRGENE